MLGDEGAGEYIRPERDEQAKAMWIGGQFGKCIMFTGLLKAMKTTSETETAYKEKAVPESPI